MNCPYCKMPQDSGAQVRILGQRFHKPCWVLWLRESLKRETHNGEDSDVKG